MLTGKFDVMLYVRDLARSYDYYVKTLGFSSRGFWDEEARDYVPEPPAGSDYVALSAGTQPIALHATTEEIRGGADIHHFEVEDVDAFHARLVARGVEVKEPRDLPWRWRMFFVRDPDGHVLGFYSPLAD